MNLSILKNSYRLWLAGVVVLSSVAIALLVQLPQVSRVCTDLQNVQGINFRLFFDNTSTSFYINEAYFCGPAAPSQWACSCGLMSVCDSAIDSWGRDIGRCQCCAAWVNNMIFIPPTLFLIILGLYLYIYFFRHKLWWLEGFPRAIFSIAPYQRGATVCPERMPLPSNVFHGYDSDDFEDAEGSADNTEGAEHAPAPPSSPHPAVVVTSNADNNPISSNNSSNTNNHVRALQNLCSRHVTHSSSSISHSSNSSSSIVCTNPLTMKGNVVSVTASAQPAEANKASDDTEVTYLYHAACSASVADGSDTKSLSSINGTPVVLGRGSVDSMNAHSHSYNILDLKDVSTQHSTHENNFTSSQEVAGTTSTQCVNYEVASSPAQTTSTPVRYKCLSSHGMPMMRNNLTLNA